MNNIARALVLPILSAGVIGGAALGLAGTASAQVTNTAATSSTTSHVTKAPSVTDQQTAAVSRHRRHRHHA